MKIYTRSGDDGTTGLVGGARVGKGDARLDCYGTIDELNAAIGLAVCGADERIVPLLRAVQNELFAIGSHLAVPDAGLSPEQRAKLLPPLDEGMAGRLEREIDAAEAQLASLRQFILPGGSETAARLHLARTVCRRAERLLSHFAQGRPVPAAIMTYANRLSDWLFVHARLSNHLAGITDIPWKK